jgi:hypothetical protein
MTRLEEDPSSWFFPWLSTFLAQLEESNQSLLQDLGYSESGRKQVAWEIASMLHALGLRVSTDLQAPWRPIVEVISQELLAICVLKWLEEHSDVETLKEWTISQSGWYAAPKTEERDAAAVKASGDTVSPLQLGHTRPWRSHRCSRPQRRVSGDDDQAGPL